MATSCHHLFCCYTSTEEYDGTLPLSSSSQTQRRQNTKKNQQKKPTKGRELTFKLPLCPFTFGSRFCPLAFALPFQVLYWHIFLLKQKKKKTHIEKKNIKKKKMHRREGVYLQAPALPFHF
jgi:hypothetical protein